MGDIGIDNHINMRPLTNRKLLLRWWRLRGHPLGHACIITQPSRLRCWQAFLHCQASGFKMCANLLLAVQQITRHRHMCTGQQRDVICLKSWLRLMCRVHAS